MGPVPRLIAFATAVALAFGGAWGAGRLLGPDPVATAADDPAGHADGGDDEPGNDEPGNDRHGAGGAQTEPGGAHDDTLPAGLASASGGYRLELDEARLPVGPAQFRFRISESGGAALTRYAVEHDELMHLILVRRDGTNYRHVHPSLGADGVWTVQLTLTEAGSYRAFADFRPEGGERTTLGTDVHVAGEFRPVSPLPNDVADVDGYQVRLAAAAGRLTLHVTSGGRPVTDLQPYLGASGHLVALRAGDLAFLHVHPEDAGSGPDVAFAAEFPSSGRYHLFFDFRHGGVVRTAAFTLDVWV